MGKLGRKKSSAVASLVVLPATRVCLVLGRPNIPAESTRQGYGAEMGYRREQSRPRRMSKTGGLPRHLASPPDGLDSPAVGYAEG